MAKMWQGRTTGVTDRLADDFNSSISFDWKLYREDIRGSIAHATMLCEQGILSREDTEAIIGGLESILEDLSSGKLEFDPEAEDIHMFVESELTSRIGEPGKRLHTARSRNDQVALDLRLWLSREAGELHASLLELAGTILARAEEYKNTVMPGYTHLQRAQPITFGHHLAAYAEMFLRDADRLWDTGKRIALSPIGACALAGTTYPTDRRREAELLGFPELVENSLTAVADRDYAVETLSDIAILMMHLSRLSEELVLWSGWEFRFVTLDDGYTTGSSIMPQKKNPDMAELIRGKTGRTYGNLMGLLTVLKGIPLAYNKDMQEDKESVFDSVETAHKCLDIMIPMIRTLKARPENMRRAASEGFINATDLADYLVRKGLPFRTAYKLAGGLVTRAEEMGLVLETLPLEEYKKASPLFEEDVYKEIALETCVARRISEGSTGPDAVTRELEILSSQLQKATERAEKH